MSPDKDFDKILGYALISHRFSQRSNKLVRNPG